MLLKTRITGTRFLFASLVTSVAMLFFQAASYRPPDIDHAKVISSLNEQTLKKGKEIYEQSCVACHGKDGTASLPQARSFNKDKLRFGNKPYDMWKTISFGAGMMAAQTWLQPAERYYVIQYIREQFIRKSNPRQYFKITDEYLATLPKSQKSIEQQLAETKKQALKGSLKYGQEWFMHHKSNYGPAIHSQLENHTTASLTVSLDKNVQLAYSLLRMGTVAAWQGNLNVSDTKYKRYRGEGEPFIEGKELDGLQRWQWTYNGTLDSLDQATGVRTPLPAKFMEYHGHYRNGKKVILSYSINGRNILELPAAQGLKNNIVLSQTLKIGPGDKQAIYIGHLQDSNTSYKNSVVLLDGKPATGSEVDGRIITSKTAAGKFIAAAIVGNTKGWQWKFDDSNRLLLTVPASNETITVEVLRMAGKGQAEWLGFMAYMENESALPKIAALDQLVKGGPPAFNKKVVVKGELNVARPHFDTRYFEDKDKTAKSKLVTLPSDYPYTVDNIRLPFDNAYNSWVRPTSVGFKSDGTLILTTYMGDVWAAKGIDDKLNEITWQRIATGLYEPMGLKVVDDNIYITCRNGITLLHDLNGDNETDFYENFHSDHDVSAFFHAFCFGLETDSEGNFYYTKPGQYTNNRDPGNVIKVSPDGKNWESIATGFRVDNGITITPDDKIFVSDNQGNWTPANKINYIERGKYYGYVQNVIEKGWSPDGMVITEKDIVNEVISPAVIPVPDTFQPPALWMPQEFDNSPGGGVWSNKNWGPYGDQFIHTSYGTGWMYCFFPHQTDGAMQGAMVAMPFQFDAGIQRATVNPVDGQVYVTGLTGWDDGVSTKYGVLSRVRYTGGKGHLLTDAEVVKGGVKLTFNFTMDDEVSLDKDSYEIMQWNYKRTHEYGSAHYSLKNPGQEGMDTVNVDEVIAQDGGSSLLIKLNDMSPVQTMRIRFKVKGVDGAVVKDVVYLTINKLPE